MAARFVLSFEIRQQFETIIRSPGLPVRRLYGLLSSLAICTLISSAAVPDDEATSDPIWNLPVVERVTIPQPNVPAAEYPNCSVEPLPEILDAEAVRFEKFRRLVTSVGGTFDLKSAYRPLAYQEHLQQVWFKWMRELRFNRQPGCQALRAQVNDEFTRHKLMPTQMPVTDSDHTRGLAFDAAVMMPRPVHTTAKKRRVSVSLDRLALQAGLRRPDIRRDPVHFKLVVSSVARMQAGE
jgi:hypothetical protein